MDATPNQTKLTILFFSQNPTIANLDDMASSENKTQSDQSSVTSDPGLTSSQSNAVGTVQECYTPNILRYLQTGEGPRPTVKCSICYTQLFIQGLHHHNADNNVDYEEPIVLPCGHVLGGVCFLKWSLTQLAGLGPRCPVCRESSFSASAEVDAARRDTKVRMQALYYAAEEEEDAEESEEESEEEESEEEGPVSKATLRPAASTWPVLPPGVTGLSDDEDED